MQGSDPFYFYFFILKGASAPPFYLGTPDGGCHSPLFFFDDCMENDTWVMWDRHRTGESKGGFDLRNPKPETRNRQRKLVSIDETRNPKPTAKVGFKRRNPKPETRNRQQKWVSIDETRNPKPETDSESWFQATKPETRNPKPTAKVGFNRRNPKPEIRNRQRKLVSIDETRNPKPTAKVGFKRRNPKPETGNPKPTRIRLLGGSPDRNSLMKAVQEDVHTDNFCSLQEVKKPLHLISPFSSLSFS